MAQVAPRPALIVFHVSGMAPVVSTAVGEVWSPVVEPLPSCPVLSVPQHQAVSSAAMAQVWKSAALIAFQRSGIAPAVSTDEGAT
jgi:hypothetical protein